MRVCVCVCCFLGAMREMGDRGELLSSTRRIAGRYCFGLLAKGTRTYIHARNTHKIINLSLIEGGPIRLYLRNVIIVLERQGTRLHAPCASTVNNTN